MTIRVYIVLEKPTEQDYADLVLARDAITMLRAGEIAQHQDYVSAFERVVTAVQDGLLEVVGSDRASVCLSNCGGGEYEN